MIFKRYYMIKANTLCARVNCKKLYNLYTKYIRYITETEYMVKLKNRSYSQIRKSVFYMICLRMCPSR